jgi:hypothetical protein
MNGMAKTGDALIQEVRIAVYGAIEATGNAPSAAELARNRRLEPAAVEDAYRALADAHVIVLRPGTAEIMWAPPFSAVPTMFLVRSGRSSWFAPCAWDAFGIPAAIDHDARIETTCGWSNEPIPCGVEFGYAYGEGVLHLLVPAAHFWDDIAYT